MCALCVHENLLLAISYMLHRIIVRIQTRLRELGAIDWTVSTYLNECTTGEKNCFDAAQQQDCPSAFCSWSDYDPSDPSFGGSCATLSSDPYCDGEKARTMQDLIDVDTSTGLNKLANGFADALALLSDAMPAGHSDHRTPPLLDFDQALYDVLGTDLKVQNLQPLCL
jgi:hypothetical protein